MCSPPQSLLNHSSLYVSGDVTIHPSATIAAGVLLQAAPDSQLVIGAEVCIASGVILQVTSGRLEIEAGVSLGTGVLILGSGRVGSKTCVGAATTILNPAVQSNQVIPANSLLGDESRQIEGEVAPGQTETEAKPVPEPVPEPASSETEALSEETAEVALEETSVSQEVAASPSPSSQEVATEAEPSEENPSMMGVEATPTQDADPAADTQAVSGSLSTSKAVVSGHMQLQRLRLKLFPYSNSLNSAPQVGLPPTDET